MSAKRICALLISLCLTLSLCACGQKADATWQEQYDLGVRYLSEGNYEEAVLAFTAAIEIEPKRAESYLGLADAYIAVGDMDAARKALEDGFAATENADIRDMLASLSSSAENSASEDGTEYPEQAGTAVSGTLALSGLRYRYASAGETVEMNEGAVGQLQISGTVEAPDDLIEVLIWNWYDEVPDEAILRSGIAIAAEIWREDTVLGGAEDTLSEFEQTRPVYPEDLGHTQYVLLIGWNKTGKTAAYALVAVEIPS